MTKSNKANSKTLEETFTAPDLSQANSYDLVCFSHLRWNFVYQRPQHIMSRFAQERRVFFVEEPVVDGGPSRLVANQDPTSGVWVVVPHILNTLSKEEGRKTHREMVDQLFSDYNISRSVLWYYTPIALGYTDHLKSNLVVYDCMDELSAFRGAHPKIKEYENRLLKIADLVFTGGHSLFEAKRGVHPKVYAFPSSIDYAHFARARQPVNDPIDQAGIPQPRLGFFGVIDERMDLDLIAGLADARPSWQIMMVGPIAKVDPMKLPRRVNIHYLGIKTYQELPNYLAGWDVALLPFALNESTRYISPTKTPEYLAGGRPVVSTPIQDVIKPYGDSELVLIANGLEEFINACQKAITLNSNGNKAEWLKRVDKVLSQNSWELTWRRMSDLIQENLTHGINHQNQTEVSQELLNPTSTIAGIGMQAGTSPLPRRIERQQVFDYLIVGSGFAGAILAERLACGSGKKVLLIDKRNHIGGNAFDHYDEHGILVHKYGPHIFHTNSRDVFAYLSRFTKWRQYEHRVRASVDGHLLPMPINLDTINQLYGTHLSAFELEKFFESQAEKRDEILTSEDVVVSKVGRTLYEKFFRNYTRKQWDLDPSELDASVTSRVPIRQNRDDRYFSDTFQSMPLHGYTRMFENILDHRNIHIMLNTDYHDLLGYVSYNQMVFTGPVDEFFDYRYGRLPYRSLQFKFETLDEKWHQPVAVINYPNEHLYTRVTEFKHLTGQEHEKTTLVYEYPCSEGDPYYPIPRPENAGLYKKYKALADEVKDVFFCGRLATYKYYNMDQVAAQALTMYARMMGLDRKEALATYTPGSFNIDLPCSLMINMDIEE